MKSFASTNFQISPNPPVGFPVITRGIFKHGDPNDLTRCVARFSAICTIKKNGENTHGGVLLFVKFQGKS